MLAKLHILGPSKLACRTKTQRLQVSGPIRRIFVSLELP